VALLLALCPQKVEILYLIPLQPMVADTEAVAIRPL
jgi:hypothetical protein